MTRTDVSDFRLVLLPLLVAVVLCAAAVASTTVLAAPLATAAAVVAWWLALPFVACAAVGRAAPADTSSMPWSTRAMAVGALIGAHGLLHAALVALPLYWWWRTPSMSATLAVAAAVAVATLLPWRVWPALALVLLGRTAHPDAPRAVGWHLDRSLRGARALTANHDLFPSHGLPVLCLHSALLLLPLALPLLPASTLTLRSAAAVGAIALAWLAWRAILLRSRSLLELATHPAQGDGEVADVIEPIPANALLRSAALRAALRAGSVERTLAIIDAGVDPAAPALPDEDDQRDALTIAATLNDSRPLRAMIATGADVNHRCHDLTPLLAATRDSYYGRAETVLVLLANGADLDARDELGRSALHHAALSAEPAVAAIVLDAGAPIDALDGEGLTPLARACAGNNSALIALLLERRASVNAGSTPPLCAAAGAAEDDADAIARLLRARAAVDGRDGDARTALHHAVIAGHLAIAAALIAAGASVDVCDRDGRTPLHLACEQGDADSAIVRLLRAAGADVEVADAAGVTALSLLSQRKPQPPSDVADDGASDTAAGIDELLAAGRQGAVQMWLRNATPAQRAEMALAAAMQGIDRSLADALATPLPADVTLPDGRCLIDAAIAQWPLSAGLLAAVPGACVSVAGGGHLAALLSGRGGAVETLQTIALSWLDAGADPFADRAGSGSALHHAVALGMERLVLRLLERGVDARAGDRHGVTPMHLALRHSGDAALRLSMMLMRHGADPEASTCSGETPLGLALDGDRAELVDGLRWRDWRLPGRRLGGHDLVAAAQAGDINAVRRLLSLGLDIEGRDHQGCTALIRAAGGGHRELLDALLAQGADIGARAHSGSTALVAALMSGHVDIVKSLLDRGAPVDQCFANDATALIIAAACGSQRAVDVLLAAGADIAARDAAGNTALHAAAGHAFGSADSITAHSLLLDLVSAGAQVDASNAAGQTVLHVACGASAAARADAVGIDAALDVLLSRTLGIGDTDGGGCTPLHYAAAHGQLGAVRRLLARGADAARRDHGGWRAADYAQRYGYTEVAQLLRPPPLSAALPLRPG